MSDMTKEQLQEELQSFLRGAMTHPPFPPQGTLANKALMDACNANPMVAQIVLPRIMAATLDWGKAIVTVGMSLSLFGFTFDLKQVEMSKFQQNLMGE
jgi:hypothetical protein